MPPVTDSDLLLALDGAASGGSLFQTAVLVVAMVGVSYFLFIRPAQQERKAQETLMSSLAKDDHVITTSGIHGRVFEVRQDTVVLELADRVRVEFDKSAVRDRRDATTA